jgi:small-conductance mechanosensitive channel
MAVRFAALTGWWLWLPALAAAQPSAEVRPAPSGGPPPTVVVSRLTEAAPASEAASFRYGNRPIVVLRGRLLARSPAERAEAAVRRLDGLVAQGITGPVRRRFVEGIVVLLAGEHDVVSILPTDVDELAGETLDAKSLAAERQLAQVLADVVEARSPQRLLYGGLRALAATLLALVAASLLWWLRRRVAAWLLTRLEAPLRRKLEQVPVADLWQMAELRTLAIFRAIGRIAVAVAGVLLAYAWLTFVLRQFPYTRYWGDALHGFVLATLAQLGQGLLAAVPGLFTVLLIVLATRLAARLASGVFRAVGQGRLVLPGLHPDTAEPSRRLAIGLLWIFAVVVAYPYIPGSGSDAFKGVSVFLGLMVSLGSSGLVNQAMSSFMITYARALRAGDFVRIGEVEGTVVHSGLLATKLRTPRNEEVTLPNAVVASSTITNYSRHAGEGVLARTTVTIGYDAPWRQVEAMLLEAARRTAGVRREPEPRVLQAGLQDFYVEYALLVGLERPPERLLVLDQLHRHVQDVFNEHGVQIMSPHYETDPDTAKIVPRAKWFAPPALPSREPRKD